MRIPRSIIVQKSATLASDSSVDAKKKTVNETPDAQNENAPKNSEIYGPIYRHCDYPTTLVSVPEPGINTVHDVLTFAASKFGERKALGSRPLLEIIKEMRPVVSSSGTPQVNANVPMKEWVLCRLGPYHWLTYKLFCAYALHLSAALVDPNGVCKMVSRQEIACIYSKTCPEWQISAHACFAQSLTICTAYESLGVEGLAHVLFETESSVIFLQPELAKIFLEALPSAPAIRTVVLVTPLIRSEDGKSTTYTEAAKEAENIARSQLTASAPQLKITSLSEIFKDYKLNTQVSTKPPSPVDIACIMYTSGSTGKPKGVMLSHSNLVASTAGKLKIVDEAVTLTPEEVFIAYLPLAHVLEFVVECAFMILGLQLGYGSPRTLSDDAVRGCFGDVHELRPTIMAGVPAVWDTFSKKIREKVKEQPLILRCLFNAAVSTKLFCINHRLNFITNFLDATILRRVRALTGGRLRLSISGGAQLSGETQLFLSGALCPLIQGYGMTETCGGGLLCNLDMPITANHAGAPIPAVELRLRSIPDCGYDASDSALPASSLGAAGSRPSGELMIRGNSIFVGYFKRPDLTSEAIDSETGWFSTGDVAARNPDGTFSIIDRAKNLVKLSNGEYIALERLESLYGTAAVTNRVCIHVEPGAAFAVVIVQPNPQALCKLANALAAAKNKNDDKTAVEEGSNIPSKSATWMELCSGRPDINRAVHKQLQEVARNAKLASAEIPRTVILSELEWLPDTGLVTASMKLNRRALADRYRAAIDEAYKSS